jgi:hypothetical protein
MKTTTMTCPRKGISPPWRKKSTSHRPRKTRQQEASCDSLSTCKLGTLCVSVKYVLASVKLVCVYVKLLKT